MGLSASDEATLNFYQWEYKYRGYYHFETPVYIEPPHIPFKHLTDFQYDFDDGRVPSLLDRFSNLLSPSDKQKEIELEQSELNPDYLVFDDQPHLIGLSISFPKGTEIFSNRNVEFLSMLSFSEHALSFEIIGGKENIVIQIVCSERDRNHVISLFKAYYPSVIIREIEVGNFGFSNESTIAIADFGINCEFMLPIATVDSLSIDPLTSIIATMDALVQDDIAVFQVLFKGVSSPLAKDITASVSDGAGGSFFSDAPYMTGSAKSKISKPLFSVIMRVAAQGENDFRSEYLANELMRSVSITSTSEHNKLIPLSNHGYDYNFHEYNLHHRLSNRLGFILNADELNTFVHYPNKTVVSQKLGLQSGKTKKAPPSVLNQRYVLGANEHSARETEVTLNDEMRLRHTHIIGATGVGKSTLIANMLIEDMKNGNGCALFDPHGDIVEDVLARVPEHRIQDVILIDPSDSEYAIGFNLLGATTDTEKIVLGSDLVSSFKRHATAWGDNMSAVLSNAINTFLESSRDGTLIELKRFLLEEKFRNEFLTSVEDPSIHYYWNNEYAMVRKGIAPLLTRIDTFLRPKVVRYMLAQTKGIDFRACIEEKKIVLIKLSQGLIGEENSFLLGSLFLSKFNQVAQGRQSLPKSQRHPYYIYLDEFQNFITPSITRILSGARKYGLGLILAHQELAQIDDTKTLNSVISNPYIRICFRLGDNDAKRLESGFSYFDQSDLQNLGVGEAIVRVGSAKNDFNITTRRLSDIQQGGEDTRNYIIKNTREKYAQKKSDLNNIIVDLLPKQKSVTKKETRLEKVVEEKKPLVSQENIKLQNEEEVRTNNDDSVRISEEQRQGLIEQEESSTVIRDHKYLQTKIKKLGQQRGFLATVEKETSDGGRIDIALERGVVRIAFEISVTNTPHYEVKNIKKCLANGYIPVVMVSKNRSHLNAIQNLAQKQLSEKDFSLTTYIQPHEVAEVLDTISEEPQIRGEVVKGFRITTEFESKTISNSKNIREQIAKMLFKRK